MSSFPRRFLVLTLYSHNQTWNWKYIHKPLLIFICPKIFYCFQTNSNWAYVHYDKTHNLLQEWSLLPLMIECSSILLRPMPPTISPCTGATYARGTTSKVKWRDLICCPLWPYVQASCSDLGLQPSHMHRGNIYEGDNFKGKVVRFNLPPLVTLCSSILLRPMPPTISLCTGATYARGTTSRVKREI